VQSIDTDAHGLVSFDYRNGVQRGAEIDRKLAAHRKSLHGKSRVIQSANGGKILPTSFGVGRRLSGSPVKPEATMTEAVDAVIRINENESHREVI